MDGCYTNSIIRSCLISSPSEDKAHFSFIGEHGKRQIDPVLNEKIRLDKAETKWRLEFAAWG